MESGKVIAASYLFTNVFGETNAVRGLNFLIALSAFGNLIAVLLGSSRMLRECGGQGVLPFPKFWASTEPFGTPAVPYLLKLSTTVIVILAVPAGDAFSFSKNRLDIGRERSLTVQNSGRSWDVSIFGFHLLHGNWHLSRTLEATKPGTSPTDVQSLECFAHLQHLHPSISTCHALVSAGWRCYRR